MKKKAWHEYLTHFLVYSIPIHHPKTKLDLLIDLLFFLIFVIIIGGILMR
jgi:hypothetical protein